MSSTGPAEQSARPPSERSLCLGVILWSDDPEVEPTVIADRSPVSLARSVALTIHEMLVDPHLYAGATEFLQEQPPPQYWVLPEDVDEWLEALREATPYPAYSFHQVPVTGGVDGTNHTVVHRHLELALQEREQALTADPDAASPDPASSRTGPGLPRWR